MQPYSITAIRKSASYQVHSLLARLALSPTELSLVHYVGTFRHVRRDFSPIKTYGIIQRRSVYPSVITEEIEVNETKDHNGVQTG